MINTLFSDGVKEESLLYYLSALNPSTLKEIREIALNNIQEVDIRSAEEVLYRSKKLGTPLIILAELFPFEFPSECLLLRYEDVCRLPKNKKLFKSLKDPVIPISLTAALYKPLRNDLIARDHLLPTVEILSVHILNWLLREVKIPYGILVCSSWMQGTLEELQSNKITESLSFSINLEDIEVTESISLEENLNLILMKSKASLNDKECKFLKLEPLKLKDNKDFFTGLEEILLSLPKIKEDHKVSKSLESLKTGFPNVLFLVRNIKQLEIEEDFIVISSPLVQKVEPKTDLPLSDTSIVREIGMKELKSIFILKDDLQKGTIINDRSKLKFIFNALRKKRGTLYNPAIRTGDVLITINRKEGINAAIVVDKVEGENNRNREFFIPKKDLVILRFNDTRFRSSEIFLLGLILLSEFRTLSIKERKINTNDIRNITSNFLESFKGSLKADMQVIEKLILGRRLLRKSIEEYSFKPTKGKTTFKNRKKQIRR